MELRELSRDEYLAGIKAEVNEKGLRAAIAERLDEIVNESRDLGYMGNAFVIERAIEILDLIDAGVRRGRRSRNRRGAKMDGERRESE